MRILWLSANRFGYEVLKEAVNVKDAKIIAIITLSDKSKTVMYDGIEKYKWREFEIEVYEVDKLNDEEELIKKLSPDIVFMCGWRQIVSKNIFKIPKKGFIGFHPTLLPIGRGPAPIINSLLQGFKESGVTMFYVSEGIDDGDIIAQEKFPILEKDHAEEVYNKTIEAGKEMIKKYIHLLIEGKSPRVPQDNSKATIFEKPSLRNNEINLDKESADDIFRKIKALSKPYKGAYIRKDGKKLIIWRAELQK